MIEGVYGKTKPPVCLKGDNKAEDLKGSIVGILNFTLQSCSVDFLKPAGADSFTRLTPLIPSTGAFLLRILFANSLGLKKSLTPFTNGSLRGVLNQLNHLHD